MSTEPVTVEGRSLFEAAGIRLYGWGADDFELDICTEYKSLQVRTAWAMWKVARDYGWSAGYLKKASENRRADLGRNHQLTGKAI